MERIDPDLPRRRTRLAHAVPRLPAGHPGQPHRGPDRPSWPARLGPSPLTLAGLIKHLALVEDSWFTDRILGHDTPEPWAGAPWDDDRDWEFHSAADDEPAVLLGLYADACARSREAVAGAADLDQLSVATHDGTRPALLAAVDPRPHDRGDGAPQRARRPLARIDRRAHG